MLRSGGPKMTVKSVGDQRDVVCVWFDKMKMKQETFTPESLRLVKKYVPES